MRGTRAKSVGLGGDRRRRTPLSSARRPRAATVGDRVLAGQAGLLALRRPAAASSAGVRSTGTGRRAGDHQGDLAAHLAGRGPLGQLGQRARASPLHRSWSARGTPRPAGRPRTRATRSASDVGQPVRRLEEDQRARLGRPAPPAPAARRRPCAAGTPRSRTGRPAAPTPPARPARRTGRAARVTVDPGLDRGRHQPVARVRHRRHAGVGHHQHVLARRAARRAAAAPGPPRWPRRTTPPARTGAPPDRRTAAAAGGCPRPRSPAVVAERRRAAGRRRRPGCPAGSPPAAPVRVVELSLIAANRTISRVTATLEAPSAPQRPSSMTSTTPTSRRPTRPTRRRAGCRPRCSPGTTRTRWSAGA